MSKNGFTRLPEAFKQVLFFAIPMLTIMQSEIYAQSTSQPVTYPKVTGYVGIMHPLFTFNKTGTQKNFDGAYVGGLPAGINIWKNSKIGFSMEFVPFVRAVDGSSKMSNFLFHPGALFGLGHGFVLAARAAFETSGRLWFYTRLKQDDHKKSKQFLLFGVACTGKVWKQSAFVGNNRRSVWNCFLM